MKDLLLIPRALSGRLGILVNPDWAEAHDPEGLYKCPMCEAQVYFRHGSKRARAHFAHNPDMSCGGVETDLHRFAKDVIVAVINEWSSGDAKSPEILRECPECGRRNIRMDLPSNLRGRVHAETEIPVGGTRIDVAMVKGDVPIAGVEILVSHKVDEAKLGRLAAVPFPFIELDAEDVVNDDGVWKPVLDRFSPALCTRCIGGDKPDDEESPPAMPFDDLSERTLVSKYTGWRVVLLGTFPFQAYGPQVTWPITLYRVQGLEHGEIETFTETQFNEIFPRRPPAETE
ncbi:MAG: hypothetical protein JXA21_03850 [Anaerolineae bacterium]|nr:hypothetical protein [Anaerolineae bacterium]